MGKDFRKFKANQRIQTLARDMTVHSIVGGVIASALMFAFGNVVSLCYIVVHSALFMLYTEGWF